MNKSLNKSLSIDKSNWTKVKLGEVIAEPKDTVNDFASEQIEHVVGLEHIDSEDIQLRRSANMDSSTTFTKKFSAGDVLFGRRRAYLKKAAQAKFSGICSGDINVMRAKEGLLPELLPFVINNDKFFDYAVKHSAGGLSPRVKFKDLAHYEFLLPSKDQQAKLAELLWTMNDVIEQELTLLDKLKQSYFTSINQFMMRGLYLDHGVLINTKCGLVDSRVNVLQLRSCLKEKPSYGANASAKQFVKDSPRYIRITDIDDSGKLLDDDIVTIDSNNFQDYVLEDNDFLFARTGNTVGKTLLYKNEYGLAVYAGYLIRFRLNMEMLRPKFLFYFTKSLKYESFKRKMVKVGAQPNINSEEYQSMYLPYFSLDVQDKLIDKLDLFNEIIQVLNAKILSSQALQKSLINQII